MTAVLDQSYVEELRYAAYKFNRLDEMEAKLYKPDPVDPASLARFWRAIVQKYTPKTASTPEETNFLELVNRNFFDLYSESSRYEKAEKAGLDPRSREAQLLAARARARLGYQWFSNPEFIDVESECKKNASLLQLINNAFAAAGVTHFQKAEELLSDSMKLYSFTRRSAGHQNTAVLTWLCLASCVYGYYMALIRFNKPKTEAMLAVVNHYMSHDTPLPKKKAAAAAADTAPKKSSAVQSEVKLLINAGETVHECNTFLFVDVWKTLKCPKRDFQKAFQVSAQTCVDLPIHHLKGMRAENAGLYEALWGSESEIMSKFRGLAGSAAPVSLPRHPPPAPHTNGVSHYQRPAAAAAAADVAVPAPAAAAAAAAAATSDEEIHAASEAAKKRAEESVRRYYGDLAGAADC